MRSWFLQQLAHILEPKWFIIVFTTASHLSQMHTVHALPSYLSKIHCNIILQSVRQSSMSLCPSGFSTKMLYVNISLLHMCHVLQPYHIVWD